MSPAEKEISIKEASFILDYEVRSIRRLLKEGKLKGELRRTKTGRSWFVDSGSVNRFAEELEKEANNKAKDRELLDRGQEHLGNNMTDVGNKLSTPLPSPLPDKYTEKLESENKVLRNENRGLTHRLINSEKRGSQLEGEKIGYQMMIGKLEKFTGELMERLKLQAPVNNGQPSDISGHATIIHNEEEKNSSTKQ